MSQLQFEFETPLCRANDPVTSFIAADRVKEFKKNHHARIMAALTRAKADAIGAEQIARSARLQPYQVRKRLPELAKLGQVVVCPQTRTTSTGRPERLWAKI